MNTLTFRVASGANHKTTKKRLFEKQLSTRHNAKFRVGPRADRPQYNQKKKTKHRRLAQVFAFRLTERFTTEVGSEMMMFLDSAACSFDRRRPQIFSHVPRSRRLTRGQGEDGDWPSVRVLKWTDRDSSSGFGGRLNSSLVIR